jgi:hypothetical protein
MHLTTKVQNVTKDGSDFKPGLREYYEYRDTGVAEASGGTYAAHVIRAVPGKDAKPQWHTHSIGFQLFYVLKGWVEFEYDCYFGSDPCTKGRAG